MTRVGRRQVRLRDVISPVLRPALWSAVLGMAAAVAFAAPGYADPALPNTIPDTGTRPQVTGQLAMPGSVPTTPSGSPTTTPAAVNGPLAAQLLAQENEVAALGDQLLQLKQDRDGTQAERLRAQNELATATAALLAAESRAEAAAGDALKEAAALPPGAFGSDLHGLGALSQIQEGHRSKSALTGTEGEVIRARHAVDLANAAFTGATAKAGAAADAFTKAQTTYQQRETALINLRKQNTDQLAVIERAQEATEQQLGAGYTDGSAAGMAADPRAAGAVRYALAHLGDPYVWSEEGPHQFDCSGLMWAAYRSVGYTLPRVARDQYYGTRARSVDRSALLPGDLIFFASDNRDWRTVHHVAMYIGNGKMVHAPNSGDVVKVSTVWWSRFYAATRVFGAVPGQDVPPVVPNPPAAKPPAAKPPAPKPPTTKPPAPKPPATKPPTTPPTTKPTTPGPTPSTPTPTTPAPTTPAPTPAGTGSATPGGSGSQEPTPSHEPAPSPAPTTAAARPSSAAPTTVASSGGASPSGS
ncbi:C40 family peptidase [Plantactinospora siamensis]|uniref:C40 family peptidase n=1 Tax=Plantactinospora siamensis TaxID=555372 RepID=A0ABV6NRY9_9ACTN